MFSVKKRLCRALTPGLILMALLLSGVLFVAAKSVSTLSVSAAQKEWTIVLDPGHGGGDSGATSKDGQTKEKDLNLKIARYLKEDLESYKNVRVVLTRDEDVNVDLDRRSEIAGDEDADLLVSLHNNSFGGNSVYDHGSFVIASYGRYREDLAKEGQKLACNILYELEQTGLDVQGILLRESEDGEVYPNGKPADYYRIIKAGINNKRLQVLIEHAYMDNADDFEKHLSTEEGLQELAEADARGIARYLGLEDKETGEVLDSLKNYEETKVLFRKDEKPVESTGIYYADETEETTQASPYMQDFLLHNEPAGILPDSSE